MLSGCATTGSKAYPYFERLAIDALPAAPVEKNAAVASAGELMAIGAAAGGTGALAGGLITSLLCGPCFLVCFTGTSIAALGGATVGAGAARRGGIRRHCRTLGISGHQSGVGTGPRKTATNIAQPRSLSYPQ